MKRISALLSLLLLSALMLTGCSAASEKHILDPDQVFSGASSDDDAPPAAMLDITSDQLVSNIRIGWNMGLSLENYLTPDDPESAIATETLRGNAPASAKLFEGLMDSGVNAVRLPITWQDHIDEQGSIEEGWMNRITQVVNYAYDSGMYVILTMYHDGDSGSWLRSAAEDRDKVLARYRRIWQQLAEKFGGYNERILFESMNEVCFPDMSEDDSYALLNEINRIFVDTVRSSGGNNPWRHLLIAGYNADIILSSDSRFQMPDDPSDRCILSVHYYVSAGLDGAQDSWGSDSDRIMMENMITGLKTAFTDNGIPVIITEYTACGDDIPGRVYFCEMLTKLCRDAGIAAFLWDDGSEFDRNNYIWTTPGLNEALRRASGSTDYTPEKSAD